MPVPGAATMVMLLLLLVTVVGPVLSAGHRTLSLPPPPPLLRPLALMLQQPPPVSNLILGASGRYAPSLPGLSTGADKTVSFPGNWAFVFPSSGKSATKTMAAAAAPTLTPPGAAATTATTTKQAPTSSSSATTAPLRPEAATDSVANIATVDGFSQVFGKVNSVLDEPQVSRCVWAIVTCCSPGSRAVRYGCFEQAGCHGAFWGTSPCERRIASSALEAALQFYL